MRLALLATLLCACGLQKVPGAGDGGTGGGTAGNGTGGGATGGGSAAGGTGTGGMGMYTFEPVTLRDSADGGPITGISGPADNLFAVSNHGKVFRSTDGVTFDRAFDAARELYAVYVAGDGRVFVAADGQLGACIVPPCTAAGAFTWTSISQTRFRAMCGDSSSNVYAVGFHSADAAGVVVHWTGSNWGPESMLNVSLVLSCWLESPGVLWAAGTKRVSRWNGLGTPTGADLSALGAVMDYQQWYSVFGIGGQLHVVGLLQTIMSRSAAETWSLTLDHHNDNLAREFHSVIGLRADEVFAVGHPPTAPGNELWRWDGTSWTMTGELPGFDRVYAQHAIQPNTLFFGGHPKLDLDTPLIVRFVRQH